MIILTDNKKIVDPFLEAIQKPILKQYDIAAVVTNWETSFNEILALYQQNPKIVVNVRGGLSFDQTRVILHSINVNKLPFEIYGRKFLDDKPASDQSIAVIVTAK